MPRNKTSPRRRRSRPRSPSPTVRRTLELLERPRARPSFASATPDTSAGSNASTVVAVGASAGGLEAFSQVLGHLPGQPDLAIIFIQHLSPQHESALAELLSPRTRLPVVQVTDGLRIQSNHVYVVPPNAHMEVADGRLHLLPRPTDRTQFTPIDFFFLSVARAFRDRAIGVVLSGTASDGAMGIREIKEAGGITIAQRPDTASHDGMPRAAVATGMVDLVLTAAEIGEHLSDVHAHPYLSPPESASSEMPFTDVQLREILSALRRTSSIDFRQYKTPTVKRRLLRRMALARLTDPDAYVRFVSEHATEAKALSQDLLIHVTRFFRDPEAFTVLSSQVFEVLAREPGDQPLRIWIPGCASGEEAYSVAICVMEALGDRLTERRVQIFATDVSDSAVEQARTGVYPVSIGADISPERLRRYFTKSDGGYRVAKIVRDMCVFARHDLTRDAPFSRLDLIVCRNVLIYMDLPLQKRLISVFHYALKPRGFLMLGPAETPGPQSLFTATDKKWRLFRKGTTEPLSTAFVQVERQQDYRSSERPHRPVPFETKPIQDEATRLVLERFAPPGVVVDGNLQIVQFRGHTGSYLEAAAGEPNLSLLKMARGGLLDPLRTAVQAARRRGRPVRKNRVAVQHGGEWKEIAIEVVPMTTAQGEHFLVLFDEILATRKQTATAQRRGRPHRAPGRTTETRVGDLRRELAANREYLQAIIQELEAANEELQSANEEILSSNEELQSTNEELDTAKEELQSTNEELNTVNEELHSRNEELTRVNSDLVNLLGSVDIPIVIVGSALEIRRFTPKAGQMFNLIPGDVGRPIGQINPNFEYEDLEQLIRDAIDHVAPQEREVRDNAGRWHSLQVRPYKGLNNRLEGAVVAVIDIDAVKRYEAHVVQSRKDVGGAG